jgi:hypothetical protein
VGGKRRKNMEKTFIIFIYMRNELSYSSEAFPKIEKPIRFPEEDLASPFYAISNLKPYPKF